MSKAKRWFKLTRKDGEPIRNYSGEKRSPYLLVKEEHLTFSTKLLYEETYNMELMLECPDHPDQFYTPDSYCDKCYIEEKD